MKIMWGSAESSYSSSSLVASVFTSHTMSTDVGVAWDPAATRPLVAAGFGPGGLRIGKLRGTSRFHGEPDFLYNVGPPSYKLVYKPH